MEKTGYEYVPLYGKYYYATDEGVVQEDANVSSIHDVARKHTANYYSDHSVAENNAKADDIFRQLRRFAAENGGIVSFHDVWYGKSFYTIGAERICDGFALWIYEQKFSPIPVLFATREAAKAAMDRFADQILWLLIEYEPMPKGWWDQE